MMFADRLLLAMFSLALCVAPLSATEVDFFRKGQVPPLPPRPPTAEATGNESVSAPAPDAAPVTGQESEPKSGGGSGGTTASASATGPCAALLSLADDAEPAVGAPCGCNRDQDGREVSLMVWQSVSPQACVDA